MEYRYLGRSGLQVSALGLGTNNFGGRTDMEQSAKVVHQALDIGVNFIDTADGYGGGRSEEIIGATLEGHRHRAVLATKVGMISGKGVNERGASRAHIMQQVETSLKKLRTDYIDLYQIHLPDPRTPIEETLRALDDLVRQGKVRYIGCSNFSAWQTCEAAWTSRTQHLAPFVTTQMDYSLVNRQIERELVPFCQAYQVGIIPYFPLASGLLTGKYRAGEPPPAGTRFASQDWFRGRQNQFLNERNFALVARLEKFATEKGHTIGELAIAWLLGNPLVCSVIAGATKPEQVVANAKAVEWRLTPKDMEEVRALIEEKG